MCEKTGEHIVFETEGGSTGTLPGSPGVYPSIHDRESCAGYILKNEFSGEQLTKKHPLDAGLDIRAAEDVWLDPLSSFTVSTGLFIAINEGYVGIVKSRSGLSVSKSIEVGAGVIDSNYRGEVKVKIYNHDRRWGFRIKKGDRIAQLLTFPVCLHSYKEVDALPGSDRGEKGFGSSGVA